MRFEVLVLGSSSATPMFGRNPTAQLLRSEAQVMLIDCGEGTQVRLSRYGIKLNKIDHIFISHLHGDHYLGLMGLISSMHLMGRKRKLHLYGPVGLLEILEIQFKYSQTDLRFELIFQETDPFGSQIIMESQTMIVRSFPLDHRIPCTGFVFSEKPRKPSLNAEAVERIGIPKSFYKLLKAGHDYVAPDGKIYPWQELTFPAKAIRQYAFCSDTIDSGAYHPYIQNVDLLYHEATFLDDMRARAAETFHTTALQAATIAGMVGAKSLLIGHYSARYKDLQPLLDEAKSVFDSTELAIEGKWYPIGEGGESPNLNIQFDNQK